MHAVPFASGEKGVYAANGLRAFSPKLARVMVRAAQLVPAVGYLSPRTIKCRGLEKSKSSKKAGQDLMYSNQMRNASAGPR